MGYHPPSWILQIPQNDDLAQMRPFLENTLSARQISRALTFKPELSSILENVQTFIDRTSCLDNMGTWSDGFNQDLLDVVENSFALAEPYLDKDVKEQCEEVLRSSLTPTAERRSQLPRLDFTKLLSILLSIYTAIISSMPSPQLDRIIEQNEIGIEQQANIIELSKARNHVLEQIAKSIDLLNERFELVIDELEMLVEKSNILCDAPADIHN